MDSQDITARKHSWVLTIMVDLEQAKDPWIAMYPYHAEVRPSSTVHYQRLLARVGKRVPET